MTDNFSSDEVVVGVTGDIYVADAGTALPTDIDDFDTIIAGADFKHLGYITVDGEQFTYARESTDIKAHQTRSPIRTIVTAITATLQATLMQINGDTLEFAFGGGTYTPPDGDGHWKYVFPSDEENPDDKVLLWVITDGENELVFGFHRASVTGDVSMSAVSEQVAGMPVTINFLSDPATRTIGELLGITETES